MIVCSTCCRKRCPKATDHRNACTDRALAEQLTPARADDQEDHQ